MGNQRLSTIIISGGFVVLIIGVFMLMFSEGNTTMPITDYNSSTFSGINRSLTQLNTIASEGSESLRTLQGNPDALDIIGSVFTSAYAGFLIIGQSFNVFINMTSGIDILPIGVVGSLITSVVLLAIVVIAIMFLLDFIRPGTKV